MRTVTGKTFAWTTPYDYGVGPDELKTMDGDLLAAKLTYSSNDMTSSKWVKVGDAEITVTLFSTDEIVTGQVDALKDEKQKVIADAEVKANEIEQRIQSLLAISFDG